MGMLQAILKAKCPRCRNGLMFKGGSYNYDSFLKMNKSCPVCGVDFEPEPGFYVGAMYFSYGLNMAMMIILGFLSYGIWGFDNMWLSMALVLTPIVILVPISFRLSRAMMLHLFGGIRHKGN